MIGVVRVVTLDDPKLAAEHGNIITNKYGLATRSACIPNQPYGIHDDETERVAVPKIIEVAEHFASEGVSAVVVSCAADPAVSELRKRLTIPVVGAGSSAAFIARGLGLPTGVLGITDDAPQIVKGILGELLVGYTRPKGVTSTVDLLTPQGRQKGVEAARTLLGRGAHAILFACTGYSTIGLADVLRKELGCVVIDGVEAEGLLAWYATQHKSLERRESD